MRIMMLGAPGSGKGTQAYLLCERYRIPHISTGQLLRDEIEKNSKLGKQVKSLMSTGELVSDDVVMQVLDQRIRQTDARRGFVLDGYPRNIPQAQALDSKLALIGRPLQLVLLLDVDTELLVERITSRLTCSNCGAVFNTKNKPPTKKGVCDVCGERALQRRPDDKEKSVRVRLQAYHEETEPLIGFYRAQHKLRTINARSGIDEITAAMVDIVNTEIRPLEMGFEELSAEEPISHEPLTVIEGGKVTKVKTKPKPKKRPVKKVISIAVAPKAEKEKDDKTGKKAGVKKTRKAAEKEATGKAVTDKKTKAKKKTTKKTAGTKAGKKTTRKKKIAAKKATTAKKSGKKKTTTKAVTKRKTAKKTTARKPKTAAKKAAAGKRAKTKVLKKSNKKVTKKAAKKQATAKKKKAVKKTTTKKKAGKKKAPGKTVKRTPGKKTTTKRRK